MAEAPRTCPLCRVTIDPSLGPLQEVRFSNGPGGTRTKLWARVCQFVQDRGGCINADAGQRQAPAPSDYYGEAPAITLPSGPFPPTQG